VRGQVETGRWYDIRVELAGNRVRCYLDGRLIHDETAPATEHFYAMAGRDDASGDLVVKAINTAAEPVAAKLTLRGLDNVKPDAAITVLSSDDLSNNNNLDEPTRVAPAERRINTAGREFTHEFPRNSLTILRIRTR
jgi:alpha-L-arabinofuranosidase